VPVTVQLAWSSTGEPVHRLRTVTERAVAGAGSAQSSSPADFTSPPGAKRIELDDGAATDIFRVALQGAAAPDEASPTDEVVWIDGDSELLVRPLQARLVCRDALVLVGIPVFSEQSGDAEIVVPFAVGAPGLVMATESRPRGPEAIVRRWGEPLIAAAWDALMAVAASLAAHGKANAGGETRLPFELSVAPGKLRVITHAAGSRIDEPG
jgi:hypothetical protein